MDTDLVRKRTSSLSTFSEIDTSDLAGDLSELPNFDHLKDMMTEEVPSNSIQRADCVNNNNNFPSSSTSTTKTSTFLHSFQKFLKIPKIQNNNLPPRSTCPSALAPPKTQRDLRTNFSCVVCGLEFQDKSRMKDHVRSRHLRTVISCHECDRRVFSDRMARHWKRSCTGPK